jgi:hypothetical protein
MPTQAGTFGQSMGAAPGKPRCALKSESLIALQGRRTPPADFDLVL